MKNNNNFSLYKQFTLFYNDTYTDIRFKMTYPSPLATVDVVLLTLVERRLHVAVFAREAAPFAGALALPGGYIHADSDLSALDAAHRTLVSKTGIASPYLEQLATFSGPHRDPRGWSLSVAYVALVPAEALASAAGLKLLDVAKLPRLAFDHNDIIDAAVARVRTKSLYSSLPAFLCPAQFTLPQLQAVYEAVLGEPLNKVSFRRKVEELGMVESVPGGFEEGKANRPAQLYRLAPGFRQELALSPRGL